MARYRRPELPNPKPVRPQPQQPFHVSGQSPLSAWRLLTFYALMGGVLGGKVVLVTGASRGIGEGIAIAAAAEGATVVCGARDQAKLEGVVSAIGAAGGKAEAVSLDVMVQQRRREGLPDPVTESKADRTEFTAGVRAFLERLGVELLPALAADQRRRAAEATTRAGDDVVARLLATQVTLARELPDYWQRFEAVRVAFTGERRR